jgi:hypothetical protein
MTPRGRGILFAVISTMVVGVVTAYVVGDARRYHALHAAEPAVASVDRTAVADGPRIVFRHTGIDNSYGVAAMVPLDDPGGPRAFTDVVCDRVDATAVDVSCLQTKRGVVTRFEQVELDASWHVTDTVPLPGLPSRTRLSPDGTLAATTTFVSGHSYMQTGFSTATEVHEVDGRSFGNLEKFQLVIDGEPVAPADRNIWGVTFADDDNTFYATAATGGETYLVRGDLAERTLTAVRHNAECPSLSPDGTEVAYKVDGPGSGTWWSIAVLDLATGAQRVLANETANVDDQVEWLDDDTLLYGLPREKETGVTDVWAIDTDPAAAPQLLIPQAWSPSVVRG